MTAERNYLDLAGFKSCRTMPEPDIDALEALYPGVVEQWCAAVSAEFETVLAKRYAIPFALPVPQMLKISIARVVTLELFMLRGFNPSSAQDALTEAAATRARAQLQEAADSGNGLRELPLRADLAESSGVVKGGPFGYSEQSPWVGFDVQRATARDEDGRGYGS